MYTINFLVPNIYAFLLYTQAYFDGARECEKLCDKTIESIYLT